MSQVTQSVPADVAALFRESVVWDVEAAGGSVREVAGFIAHDKGRLSELKPVMENATTRLSEVVALLAATPKTEGPFTALGERATVTRVVHFCLEALAEEFYEASSTAQPDPAALRRQLERIGWAVSAFEALTTMEGE